MRALAYLRVSTYAQEENGKNLEGQLAEIQRHCAAKGYELEARDVYRDIVSGAKTDRKGYYQLLSRLERQDARVVIAYDISRFGRNNLDTAWLMAKAKEFGIQIETVAEGGRDFTADPTAEMIFGILSVIATYERRSILERMTRGKTTGRKRGNWVTGAAPFGYGIEGNRGDKRLVPLEPEAGVVRRAFEARAGGATLEAIAGLVRSSGVPTQRGGQWSTGQVDKILRNPVYLGLLDSDGNTIQGRHVPLVAQEVFDRVQARRRK